VKHPDDAPASPWVVRNSEPSFNDYLMSVDYRRAENPAESRASRFWAVLVDLRPAVAEVCIREDRHPLHTLPTNLNTWLAWLVGEWNRTTVTG
jgi:hypothetical protein